MKLLVSPHFSTKMRRVFFPRANVLSSVIVTCFHHLFCINHCHIHLTIRDWFIMYKSLIPNPPLFLLIVSILQLTKHIGFLSSALCPCQINLRLMLSIVLIIHFGSRNKDIKYTGFADRITRLQTNWIWSN
jgi:hypothetical protein